MLLWAFNFDKPLDANGVPIAPSRTACVDAGVVVYVCFLYFYFYLGVF